MKLRNLPSLCAHVTKRDISAAQKVGGVVLSKQSGKVDDKWEEKS